MCKCASFVLTKDQVFWSKTTDSHEKIIEEFGLSPDGVRGPNVSRVEICPPDNNLSLPLSKWVYKYDDNQIPDWYVEEDCKSRTFKALNDWKKCKLTGWKVKEAFNPVNPFKIATTPMTEQEIKTLVLQWGYVRSSVWDSIEDSIGDSVRNSVRNSVEGSIRDSVRDSVRNSTRGSIWDSIHAYIGGLFPCIKVWKYTTGPDPWRPLLTLWYSGRVPVTDGKFWYVLAGSNAEIEYKFKTNSQ